MSEHPLHRDLNDICREANAKGCQSSVGEGGRTAFNSEGAAVAPSASDSQKGFSTYSRTTGRFLSRKDDVQLLVLELRTFWFVRNKKNPLFY